MQAPTLYRTILEQIISNGKYCNGPKFLDRHIWANSVGAVWSGSTLFAIPSASFRYTTVCEKDIVQILG